MTFVHAVHLDVLQLIFMPVQWLCPEGTYDGVQTSCIPACLESCDIYALLCRHSVDVGRAGLVRINGRYKASSLYSATYTNAPVYPRHYRQSMQSMI